MPLSLRIAVGFAIVALATAALVALATPQIVNQGFTELQSELGAATNVVASPRPTATSGGQASDGESESEGAEASAGTGGASDSETAEEAQAALTRENEAREQVAQGTVGRLVLAAILAAIAATLLGLIVAGRLTRPLSRLEAAAQDVAQGNLSRRSGLADRGDEFGKLGRSFDSMAAELEASDENRRRFLQDAVHELRTPITVIDATASAILDGVYTADRTHLETIRDQSRLLSRIVDDLRTISLAEGGTLPLRLDRVAVAAVLDTAARGFDAQAAEKGIALRVSADPSLAVTADPDRFRQMTAALVDNAIRHSPAGGEVRIVAGPAPHAEGRLRVAVEDSGPGIPEAELPHVFDRFYQGDPAPNRPRGTSGLGLSIVQALAEAQSGSAGAENASTGGARVWFELPTA